MLGGFGIVVGVEEVNAAQAAVSSIFIVDSSVVRAIGIEHLAIQIYSTAIVFGGLLSLSGIDDFLQALCRGGKDSSRHR